MILLSYLWAIYHFLYPTAQSFINIVIEEDYVFLESYFIKCFILERILFWPLKVFLPVRQVFIFLLPLKYESELMHSSVYCWLSLHKAPLFNVLEVQLRDRKSVV